LRSEPALVARARLYAMQLTSAPNLMSNAPTLLEEIPAARRTLTNCPTHVGTGRLHVVRPRGSGRTGPAYSRGDRRPGKQGRGSRSPEGGDHAAQAPPKGTAASSSNSPEAAISTPSIDLRGFQWYYRSKRGTCCALPTIISSRNHFYRLRVRG
jgi:hypothetical protein